MFAVNIVGSVTLRAVGSDVMLITTVENHHEDGI